MLAVKKIDSANHVGANLDGMKSDTKRMRDFIKAAGGLRAGAPQRSTAE
jgi:hypothetical protein